MLLVSWPTAESLADLPALSREFRTERYVLEPGELDAIRRQRILSFAFSGGAFTRGEVGGGWDPAKSLRQIAGGRAEATLVLGRFAVGADGFVDTRRDVDEREFERRVLASAYLPEWRTTAWAAAGFTEDGYQGVDLTTETLITRWNATGEQMDLRPRVFGWMRLRSLDDSQPVLLTPALGAFIQHAIVVGSSATIGAAGMTDLSDGRSPVSQGLFILGWASGAHGTTGAADEDAPESVLNDAAADLSWSWFTQLAYAAPFDRRSDARWSVQAGIRFIQPL